MEWTKGKLKVTCDPATVDLDALTTMLASSYWAEGIPQPIVERSVTNSLCFVLLEGERQIGFARVVTDYATIGYLNDVFVLPAYRGKGLGKWLMKCVMSHPDLQNLRRWILATRDAHGLYEKYGFTTLKSPQVFMERHDPDVYRRTRDGEAK